MIDNTSLIQESPRLKRDWFTLTGNISLNMNVLEFFITLTKVTQCDSF